ncbi:DUF5706 domain-containing protein [Streptomyces sp. LP05-1]|uniref:DUF5706 domain-containing protein n=1 Tax=Streptomyces pyxinae TaxID=2970734 RepID=A0ABT2CD36_9ACTN|nr:Pycsar system effector family protein [Streptomyces sp. LP05-1]MCS0635317.1 DUF5706 domain-containing protein [Streptomyces sp. LP05-1]
MTTAGDGTGTSPDPVVAAADGGRHSHGRSGEHHITEGTGGRMEAPGERIAERLLSTIREDLGRADSKAAVLLSGALALPAFLIGWHGAPGWQRPADVVLAVAGVFWVTAVIALVRALLPRTGTVREGGGVTFFRDLLPPLDFGRLSAEVAEAGRDPAGWLLTQAVDVSSILSAKYQAIRWAVATLAPAAVLALTWSFTVR